MSLLRARACVCARAHARAQGVCVCVSGSRGIRAVLRLRAARAAVVVPRRYASWLGSKRADAAGLFDSEHEQSLVDQLFLICRVKQPPK